MNKLYRFIRSIVKPLRLSDKRKDKNWAWRYDEMKRMDEKCTSPHIGGYGCGTAFCTHPTIETAADCWADRCARRGRWADPWDGRPSIHIES